MARRRPLGVTILGSLAVVGGLILLVLGLLGLLVALAVFAFPLNPGLPGNLFLLSSAVNLIVGVVLLGTGNGLLNLRAWAWWLAAIVAFVGVVRAALSLYASVTQGANTALAGGAVSLIILLLFLGYVVSVRGHFR